MKRTPLRKVSLKRQKENRKRAVVVAELKDRYPYCQARIGQICTNRPDDAHEVLTRARGGSITDPDNMLIVCRPCHTWITDHPLEATNRGFIIHSWNA